MTKRKDPDLIGLRMACKGLQKTTERMRKATIEYLWDRFVVNPVKNDK